MDNSTRLDDVFIDPAASVTGTATCLDREWRTVMIGSYREGGSGYFALDITQPDVINAATTSRAAATQRLRPVLPRRRRGLRRPRLPHRALGVHRLGAGQRRRADGRGPQQLARPRQHLERAGHGAHPRLRCELHRRLESRIATSRCSAAGSATRRPGRRGNFVYMVDIETGNVLWKKLGQRLGARRRHDRHRRRRLLEDALLRHDLRTGLQDHLRVGSDAAGRRRPSRPASPESTSTSPCGASSGPPGDTNRYNPFVIFVTNGTPIYHEIAAVYVQQRQTYALGIGTGNRWNLWEPTLQRGRFYMLLDTGFVDADRNGTLDTPCGRLPGTAQRVGLPGARSGQLGGRPDELPDRPRRCDARLVHEPGRGRTGDHRGLRALGHHHLHLLPPGRGREPRRHLLAYRREPHLHRRHGERSGLLVPRPGRPELRASATSPPPTSPRRPSSSAARPATRPTPAAAAPTPTS